MAVLFVAEPSPSPATRDHNPLRPCRDPSGSVRRKDEFRKLVQPPILLVAQMPTGIPTSEHEIRETLS